MILPRGTNTPLDDAEKKTRDAAIMTLGQDTCDEEVRLLLQRNKWVIAHPNREPLIRQGAFGGVTGENKELFYPRES